LGYVSQINKRKVDINGTGSANQIVYKNGSNAASGDAGFTFNDSTNTIQLGDQHRFGTGTFTTAQRNALTSVATGTFIYNTTENKLNFYNGTVWVSIKSGLEATGGTITFSGGKTIHRFTGSGTFTVSSGSGDVEYLVVAGGGGGGSAGGSSTRGAGGGGAGGFRISSSFTVSSAPGVYTITVGGGGAGGPGGSRAPGAKGSNSVFGPLTSTGGGYGSTQEAGAGPGGSGGGSGNLGGTAGTGNSPPVSPPQGNPGGPGTGGVAAGSGGGGAGGSGVTGGAGGSGTANSITGSPITYAVGGSGGPPGSGGTGSAGTANRGNGGGGAGGTSGGVVAGGAGGAGVVIIAYPS
jgi:hypothetical protein